jgi:hypothetical protein
MIKSENESVELKPCPFCGGEAKLWHRRRQETKYTIGCMNSDCFVWIPTDVYLSELHNYAPCFRYLSDAVNSWNTRAKDTCIAALKSESLKQSSNT